MQIINLTAHSITEVTTGLTFPATGKVVRVKQSTTKVAEHMGIPLYSTVFGQVEGLPEPTPDTIYIVSALALQAIPSTRKDVVSPGNILKDEHGKIVGCTGFRYNA